jgi:ankyrin repeat protein
MRIALFVVFPMGLVGMVLTYSWSHSPQRMLAKQFDCSTAFDHARFGAIHGSTPIEISHDLMNYGMLVPIHNEPAFLLAVYNDCYEAARLMIENGVDIEMVSSRGFRALHIASKGGFEDMVRLLLANGADVNSSYSGGLNAAAYCNNSVLQLLIANGIDVSISCDARRPCYVCDAIQSRDAIRLQILIDANIDLREASCRDGAISLHWAAEYGCADCISIIVNLVGTDLVDAPNKFGETPLHLAVFSNELPTAAALLGFGADVDAIALNGRSPWDVSYGQPELRKLLEKYRHNSS